MRIPWRNLVAELVGTLLFFFIGAGAIITNGVSGQGSNIGLLGIALAHGLVLAVMVSALGHISGGHFNPAVTLGILAARKIEPLSAVLYIVFQLIGAVIAGLLLRVIFPTAVGVPLYLGTPTLGQGVAPLTAVLVEIVLTFILVTAVFGTAVDLRGPKIGGFGIGLAVALDILMGGPVTGAAMNPARHLGIALVAGYLDNWWVYWVGPIAGAVLAALLYRYFLMAPDTLPDAAPVVPAPKAAFEERSPAADRGAVPRPPQRRRR